MSLKLQLRTESVNQQQNLNKIIKMEHGEIKVEKNTEKRVRDIRDRVRKSN